jgi:hypothetical protein
MHYFIYLAVILLLNSVGIDGNVRFQWYEGFEITEFLSLSSSLLYS